MNIIDDYLAYTVNSESPQAYHKWTCLSMVSSLIGKRCWIKFNYFTVYPNLYLILVSLPGLGKKSTALRIGSKMVEESKSEVLISKDGLSPQALMIDLDEAYRIVDTPSGKKFGSSSLTVFASEIASLFGVGSGMVEFLTDIYDSDKSFEYKTKNSGKLTIKGPCLNLMACTTTDTFSSKILKDAVAGGLVSRSVVVFANDQKAISPFDMPPPEALEARQRVIERFAKIRDLFGEVVFTTEAKDYYETWYMKTFGDCQDKNTEFNSRKHVHVAKAAMLLALSDLTTIIELKHVLYAIEMLNEVDHYMKLIHMASGASKYSETILNIIATINEYGRIVEEDILTLFLGDSSLEDFEAQIELIMRAGYITLETEEENKVKKTYFNITPKGTELFLNYQKA